MNVADQIEDIIRPHLLNDETVVWHGQPSEPQNRILISVVICGLLSLFPITICYEAIRNALHTGSFSSLPQVIPVIAIPLAVIYAVAYATWIGPKRNNRYTYYAVSNKRVMVINTYKRIRIEECPLDNVTGLLITKNRQGAKHLAFRTDTDGDNYHLKIRFARTSFRFIVDPYQACEAIRELRADLPNPEEPEYYSE